MGRHQPAHVAADGDRRVPNPGAILERRKGRGTGSGHRLVYVLHAVYRKNEQGRIYGLEADSTLALCR